MKRLNVTIVVSNDDGSEECTVLFDTADQLLSVHGDCYPHTFKTVTAIVEAVKERNQYHPFTIKPKLPDVEDIK